MKMTNKILYIHGFASAGSSGTATQMRSHLYPKGVAVVSPDMPLSPLQAIDFLHTTVESERPDLIIGTSMGAMYAEQLYGIPRILVNPSFHMASLLTFRGLGRREFLNKRQDGATEFRVDRQMIDEFRQVEAQSFSAITPAEREMVYGLFGTQDKSVNCQPEFRQHYDPAHLILFEGEHRLNGQILSRVVMPLIERILNIQR